MFSYIILNVHLAALKKIMSNLGENLSDEIVEEMIAKVDTDGDGRIGFQGIM